MTFESLDVVVVPFDPESVAWMSAMPDQGEKPGQAAAVETVARGLGPHEESG